MPSHPPKPLPDTPSTTQYGLDERSPTPSTPNQSPSFWQECLNEIRPTLKLSIPLIAAFIGYQTISLVDTFVGGRIGVDALASISLGSALFWGITIFPCGILIGLDPLMAQALGRKDRKQAWNFLEGGLGLAFLLSAISIPLVLLSGYPGCPWTPSSVQVSEGLKWYLLGRSGAIPMLFFHTCLRCFLQAHEKTKPILLGTFIANVVNLPLSIYLGGGDLLFNELGLPSLGYLEHGWGAFGVGLASSSVSTIEVLYLTWHASKVEKNWVLPRFIQWKSICNMGLPIGGSMLSEGGVFSLSTLLVSGWATTMIGAHQITLQLASYSFTICLGISSATSVRVGHAVGQEDWRKAQGVGFSGMGIGILVMSCSSLIFFLFGAELASLLTLSPEVIHLSSQLLLIACAFQLFDGIQVIAAGALRGAGFTQIPLWSALVSHWGVGLPLSLALAFWMEWTVYGLWWGLCGGLMCASFILVFQFYRKMQKASLLSNVQN